MTFLLRIIHAVVSLFPVIFMQRSSTYVLNTVHVCAHQTDGSGRRFPDLLFFFVELCILSALVAAYCLLPALSHTYHDLIIHSMNLF